MSPRPLDRMSVQDRPDGPTGANPGDVGWRPMLPDVQRLRTELQELVHSWEFAFAMGHGCTIGDHPDFQATRQRAADLRARIAELTE
jgi:hypothetical protein